MENQITLNNAEFNGLMDYLKRCQVEKPSEFVAELIKILQEKRKIIE